MCAPYFLHVHVFMLLLGFLRPISLGCSFFFLMPSSGFPSATCKRTQMACCTSNTTVATTRTLVGQQRQQDAESYLPMESSVCVYVFVWHRLKSHSSCLCWQEQRRLSQCILWKKVCNIHLLVFLLWINYVSHFSRMYQNASLCLESPNYKKSWIFVRYRELISTWNLQFLPSDQISLASLEIHIPESMPNKKQQHQTE